MFPQDGKGVREEKIVGHSEMVDHLLLGIVFLRIYLVISVGAEEGVHVVVLALVCHENMVSYPFSFKTVGSPEYCGMFVPFIALRNMIDGKE